MKQIGILCAILMTCQIIGQSTTTTTITKHYSSQGQQEEKTATLIGTVKDAHTYKPLSNASVAVGDNVVQTNEQGKFKLGDLKNGPVTVIAKMGHYLEQEIAVKISGYSAAPVHFKLIPEKVDEIRFSEEDLLKVKLRTDKEVVNSGRQFWVFFEAPDGFESNAWIGVVTKDEQEEIESPDLKNVHFYKFLKNKVQGQLLFTIPDIPGEYEVRMYHREMDGKMVATVPVVAKEWDNPMKKDKE